MATKDMVAGVNDKLLRLRSSMVSNGDNPRTVALADCLIELTTDPTAQPAPAAASSTVAVAEPQAGAPSPKAAGKPAATVAAPEAGAPSPKAGGTCTHPKVSGGHCTFCGAAV